MTAEPEQWTCMACGAGSDRQSCPSCGSECRPAALVAAPPCKACEGTGEANAFRDDPSYGLVPCPRCKGSGLARMVALDDLPPAKLGHVEAILALTEEEAAEINNPTMNAQTVICCDCAKVGTPGCDAGCHGLVELGDLIDCYSNGGRRFVALDDVLDTLRAVQPGQTDYPGWTAAIGCLERRFPGTRFPGTGEEPHTQQRTAGLGVCSKCDDHNHPCVCPQGCACGGHLIARATTGEEPRG